MAACALASVSCGAFDEHSCSDVYYICEQTGVTLQSPGGTWAAGTYTLALTLDGTPVQCTMDLPDLPPANGLQGDCGSGATVTLTLATVDSCPPVVCNSGACGGSSCAPIPGRFQMNLNVQGIPTEIGLSLSLEGHPLTSETIVPMVTTTQPNGEGCGTCTSASATISVAGG